LVRLIRVVANPTVSDYFWADVSPLGNSPMPYYRLYHLDQHTGHISKAEELFAADDVAAMHDLQHRNSPHPLELWERGRKVGYVDAAPEAAAMSPKQSA
jgi:hypothetical protein